MGSFAKMLKLTSWVTFLLLSSHCKAAPANSEEKGLVERFIYNVYQSLFTNYEMAPYSVTRTLENGIEERVYPGGSWACTQTPRPHQTSEEDDTSSQLFWRLFQYIGGENQDQVKYEMTVPVSTLMSPGSMEMCFFMSKSLPGPPSSPTNPLVFIKEEGERALYVSRFGGFMKAAGWSMEAQRLAQQLNDQGVNFDRSSSRYYRVGYDAPFKFWNRRNEIWYPKM